MEEERLADLIAMFIEAQNPDWPRHCGITNDKKAWISVSILSSWSSLASISRVSKPLKI